MVNKEKVEKLKAFKDKAEAHWAWLEDTLHLIYVDAMVHGYTHRLDEEELEEAIEVFSRLSQGGRHD